MGRNPMKLHLNEGRERRCFTPSDSGPPPEEQGKAQSLERSTAIEDLISRSDVREEDNEILRFHDHDLQRLHN
jgi:hypothetical protein